MPPFIVFAVYPKDTAELRRQFKGEFGAGLWFVAAAVAILLWQVPQHWAFWQEHIFRNAATMYFLAGLAAGAGLKTAALCWPWLKAVRDPEERHRVTGQAVSSGQSGH